MDPEKKFGKQLQILQIRTGHMGNAKAYAIAVQVVEEITGQVTSVTNVYQRLREITTDYGKY